MSTIVGTYQGVYRAKALNVQAGVITAYVPQVFGDTPISITDVIGGLPDGPTMGWVMFESGWPEFPVWTSGVVTGSTGGGPIDPSLLANEVHVGNAPPTTPETELWFDPDAPNPTQNFLTPADMAAHVALPDPHPGYLTPTEGQGLIDTSIATHAGLANPHPTYLDATEGAALITAHTGLADPHPGYVLPIEETYRVFASKAALDAATTGVLWPGVASGYKAYTTDVGRSWERAGGAWRDMTPVYGRYTNTINGARLDATIGFGVTFTATPIVMGTIEVGSYADLVLNWGTPPTTTGVGFTVVTRNASSITIGFAIHWVAFGIRTS